MKHIQVSIEVPEEKQEKLIALLSNLPITGFEQTATHLLSYFEEKAFPSSDVKALLNTYTYTIQEIKEQNWNAVWESHFQPVMVQHFCGIRAHFHPSFLDVEHEIIIIPKMSFGTGHHATTYMMIEHMKEINFKHKTVFDFGTGTGILAILADKLKAASVYAIDHDEWSINNAAENIKMNKSQNIQLHLSSTVPAENHFDIVLANINKNIILQHLSFIADSLLPGGLLLLSGLLREDEKAILNKCTAHFLQLKNKKEKNNWLSLLLAKKHGKEIS